ncbi:MAG: Hsp20 family protein [Conexivisphaerales archaeon]
MGEDFNPDFFDDIDELLEEMEKEIEEMIKNFRKERAEFFKKPYVKGFTFEFENGRPVFRTFGDVRSEEEIREPLVEQFISRDTLNVIAEMPGVEKESINLQADEDNISIEAKSEDRVYKTHVKLKNAVDPDSGEATYKNGILEIKFRLRGNGNKAYKQLDVE